MTRLQAWSTTAPSACAPSRLAWLTALILLSCSCRSTPLARMPLPPDEAALEQRAAESLARSTESMPHMPIEPACDDALPIPIVCASPWAPPGIAGPWPHDEYLHDGGDRDIQANIGRDGEVRGLEMEDTVVVYDTKDGRTEIKPSNRVCLYAPRFGAVRQVTSVVENLQNDQLVASRLPVKANLHQDDQLATTTIQPLRPLGGIGTRQPSIERVEEGPLPAISRQPIAALDGGFATHENFLLIRQGIYEDSEKAMLQERIAAAVAWTEDKAVQVVLDGRAAVSVTGDQKAQVTFRVDEPDRACLRVIKVASTHAARPGDDVDFTIRFDNLGDTVINRVVLIDNLTTRLEYVPGTAQSSRPAEFSTEQNEGDSLVLRWEFSDPLPVGQGGLVRFHCRVR